MTKLNPDTFYSTKQPDFPVVRPDSTLVEAALLLDPRLTRALERETK